jgi:thiol:disulfide interchange protein DsbD
MKKIIVFLLMVFIGMAARAQLNPVSWTFNTKKLSEKTYEVRLTANLQFGWHLYSQIQPEDAIAFPTEIKFNNNPLLRWDGKIKEIGNLEKFKDEKLNISAHQYSKQVEFVQVVRLKGNVKTNVTGSVEYQTCDDKKCLPPKKVTFNLAVN